MNKETICLRLSPRDPCGVGALAREFFGVAH
jgi:hypothetical protein